MCLSNTDFSRKGRKITALRTSAFSRLKSTAHWTETSRILMKNPQTHWRVQKRTLTLWCPPNTDQLTTHTASSVCWYVFASFFLLSFAWSRKVFKQPRENVSKLQFVWSLFYGIGLSIPIFDRLIFQLSHNEVAHQYKPNIFFLLG